MSVDANIHRSNLESKDSLKAVVDLCKDCGWCWLDCVLRRAWAWCMRRRCLWCKSRQYHVIDRTASGEHCMEYCSNCAHPHGVHETTRRS